MNILEAMADPNVFAPHFKGPVMEALEAALAAIFTYSACTGRYSAPAVPFTEAALCVGRRAAKAGFWL